MNVTFCGHSEITNSDKIKDWLSLVIKNLIEQGAKKFYIGGYGDFDNLVLNILLQQKNFYPDIELILVLAYLNTSKDTSKYDSTVYPPLESTPPKFAILKRNQWMVEISDIIVSYVVHDWGGASKTLKYAKRKKKKIIQYGF